MIPQARTKSKILNQEIIAEQLTTQDISMRQQLAKNSSETQVRLSFQAKDYQTLFLSRKTSIKSSWFECGNSQIQSNFKDSSFSYVSAFVERQSSQKKTMKIYSLVSNQKQHQKNKKSLNKTKINVSLSKKCEKQSLKATQNLKAQMKILQKKPQKSQHQQNQSKQVVNMHKSQENKDKAFCQIKQIKQPEFQYKHPLLANKRSFNGAYISKIIANRALQNKMNCTSN